MASHLHFSLIPSALERATNPLSSVWRNLLARIANFGHARTSYSQLTRVPFARARATPPRSYKFGISRPSGRTIFIRRRKFVPLLVRWPLAVITSPILIVFLSQPPYLPSMAGLLASPAHFSISPLSFFTSR